MNEERTLLVGFDLCNDYTQISLYNRKLFEPESVYVTDDENSYLIPTVMSFHKVTGEWFFGIHAQEMERKESAVLFKDIVKAIIEKSEWKIGEKNILPITVLEQFFRKTLALLKKYEPNECILKLVITVKELNENLIDGIYKALDKIGIKKELISIQSHSQSYMYYALSQPKELWMNDVGMFDFDEKGLLYSQITLNRKDSPIVAGIKNTDFSQTLGYDLIEELGDLEGISYIFENIAKNILYKQVISTVYITGKGFDGDWADEALKKLCLGRRIFKGQNLYTKGASYAARESTEAGKLKNVLFLSEEMLNSSISLKAYKDGDIEEIVLADSGDAWYEANKTFEFILDAEQEIEFVIRHRIKHEETHQIIALEGIKSRPDRMTRIQLRIKWTDAHNCIITAKDLGFGSFYPSSERVWEKIITIA